MSEDRKIETIIAVPSGWYGVYVMSNGKLLRVPVACWAMVKESGKGRIVIGMGCGTGSSKLDFMDTGNLLGYAGPDDLTNWEKIAQEFQNDNTDELERIWGVPQDNNKDDTEMMQWGV